MQLVSYEIEDSYRAKKAFWSVSGSKPTQATAPRESDERTSYLNTCVNELGQSSEAHLSHGPDGLTFPAVRARF